jgi:MFS family permease
MAADLAAGAQAGAAPVQSDYDKVRRIPFLYAFNAINTAALLCTITTPLALYAAELGIEEGRIGILAGLLPFAQLFCVLFLPLVMQVSQRIITVLGYGVRHLFLLSWFAAPFLPSPNHAFWLLFISMSIFSLSRTMAETAIWPWSQEYLPRHIRGRVNGFIALVSLPVAFATSLLIQLWLDTHTGITRFFPVFAVGIVLGGSSVLFLLGLRGGQPRKDSTRGFAAIRAMRTPLRDGHFWLYLYSSGTQYFAATAIGLFLVLFFRERLGLSSGLLVTLAAFLPLLGAAAGSMIGGWFVDRYGTRAIRIVMQSLQVVLLLSLLLINETVPARELLAGAVFFLLGLLFQSSIIVGNIYLLNYVPPQQKENYMTLAYASDGLLGGGTTFLAGFLLQALHDQPLVLMGTPTDSYAVLFVLTAIIVTTSALAFGMLREDGATSVRTFFGYFRHGSALRALLTIPRYGALISEERRQELTYSFGGTRSALVADELIAALSDPSFDVRHEAIQSLGHLPPSVETIQALEAMLRPDGLIEVQYAALAALGRLKATSSAQPISGFLEHANPMLRARAIRSLGDLRHGPALPAIRTLLRDDPIVDCRLAAVSALGKFRDKDSVTDLIEVYDALAGEETERPGDPRSKVVLLALAKILGLEEAFSRLWRTEARQPGSSLPRLLERVAKTVRGRSAPDAEALARSLDRAAETLALGQTGPAHAALQALRPAIAASRHRLAPQVLLLLEGTAALTLPHPALITLQALAARRVLARERRLPAP